MSKKLTFEEREKLAQELIATDFSLDCLVPTKKPIKSLKTPIEKVKNYQFIIEDSVFWASRQAYLDLLQSFLSKKIDGKTLTSKFFKLRTQNILNLNELSAIIEDRILPIADLYYTCKATDFNSTINELYLEIDRYNPEIEDSDWNDIVYSESKLRSVIQERFVPELQQSCDLNDSFFRPQLNLDQLIRKSYLIFVISSLCLFTSLIATKFL